MKMRPTSSSIILSISPSLPSLYFPSVPLCLCGFLICGFLLAGCATGLKIGASADPLGILSPGASAYARLDGATARSLLPRLGLPPSDAKRLKSALERTRLVTLAVGGDEASQGSAPSRVPTFQACLLGDFPFGAGAFALGLDPAWKREKNGYFNPRLGLRAALPGTGLVLASTGSLSPLLATARAPGPSPIPSSLVPLCDKSLVLWAPFSGLSKQILGEGVDLPLVGLLVAADPLPSGDFGATVAFLATDPDSARIFRPAIRLAWYAIARYLAGGSGQEAPAADFVLDGSEYKAEGVRISSGQVAGALSKLSLALEGIKD